MPSYFGKIRVKATLGIHRGVDLKAVLKPGLVVLLPVARGDVDTTSTGLKGHVVGQDDQGLAGEEGVAGVFALKGLGLHPADDGRHLLKAKLCGKCRKPSLGKQEVFPFKGDHHVVEFRVQGHGQVGRKGPGGGGPDDEGDRLSAGLLGEGGKGLFLQGKLNVDRGGAVIVVLHLSLGQGGYAMGAPVNGFFAPVNVALAQKVHELPGDGGFVVVTHGEVGVFPVPDHPQALELLPLDVYPALGVFPALLPDDELGKLPPFDLELLFHVELDGKAVTVPARDVGAVVARHAAAFHDEVLEHLVESRSHVDVAVGIGGAVVEHEEGGILAGLEHLLVKPHLLPIFQKLWFPLGQVGLHGEVCAGEVQGVFPVCFFGHFATSAPGFFKEY